MVAELPHDLDAEASVLGGMMLYEDLCDQLVTELDAEDFYTTQHRTIFTAVVEQYAQGKPVDVISTSNVLKGKVKQLDVYACVEGVVTSQVSKNHALIVRDLASLRRMARVGEDIVGLALSHPDNVGAVVAECENRVFSVADRYERVEVTNFAQGLSQTLDVLESIYENPALVGDTPTGFPDIDYLIGGVNPGSLYILAARPGLGKTSLAVNIAHNVARLKRRVLFISLEMTKEELFIRSQCAQAGVSLSKVTRKNLASTDLEKLTKASEELSSLDINIVDRGCSSPTAMAALVRRQAKVGLGLVIIDYLQLIEADRKLDSVAAEVQTISRALKAMAKEYRVPVLAVAQLNREVEHRKGRPRLSDLRDSGAIEQDADVVMLLSREPDSKPDAFGRYEANLEVAKHRNGPTGNVELSWEPQLTTFSSKAGRGLQPTT